MTPRAQFTASAVVAVIAAGSAAATLRPAAYQHPGPARSRSALGTSATAPASAPASRFTPRLLLLSALGLCVLLIEGVVTDWGSVYLADSLHAGPGLAGAGYAAFAVAMTAGRLGGDWTAGRFGPVRVVRVGALLTAAGAMVVIVTGHPVVAVVFFALVGLGIAASFPLVVSGASRLHTGSPGTAVATVSTTGYFAFLAGPPLIGFLASHSSVRVALLLALPVLGVATALLASLPAVEERPSLSAPPTAPEPSATI